MAFADAWEIWLTKHRPTVTARLRRLNPHPQQGMIARGWHPKGRRGMYFWDRVGKREFLKRFGREAWEAMPNGLKIKDGRRQYISRVNVEDEIWRCYTGTAARPEARMIFLTKRYSNDPRGVPFVFANQAKWIGAAA